MTAVFAQLEEIIKQRKSSSADKSYVASLNEKGLNKILEKVGEESIEMILASRDLEQVRNDKTKQALIGEVADLLFHSLVMIQFQGISLSDIETELQSRFSMSGLEEKASRK